MTTQQRAFKGIWIPAETWLSRDLSLQEKVLLAEIASLDLEDRGCFASNGYLADFFNLSVRRVQTILSGLVEKGLISVVIDRDGGTSRVIRIKTPLVKEMSGEGCRNLQDRGEETVRMGVKKTSSQYKEDNKVYNKEDNKEENMPFASETARPALKKTKESASAGSPLPTNQKRTRSTPSPIPPYPPSSETITIDNAGHAALMKHHADRLGAIPDGGAQGKAVKWLLKHFSIEDCTAFYDFQVKHDLEPHGWRSHVSWLTVKTEIGEWVKRGRPKQPEPRIRNNNTVPPPHFETPPTLAEKLDSLEKPVTDLIAPPIPMPIAVPIPLTPDEYPAEAANASAIDYAEDELF